MARRETGGQDRGTATATKWAAGGAVAPAPTRTYPHPAAALPALVWRARASGEWPTGIHWTPGEVRAIPPGYPIAEPPPEWLAPFEGAE